jgi:hypothetical protein
MRPNRILDPIQTICGHASASLSRWITQRRMYSDIEQNSLLAAVATADEKPAGALICTNSGK